MVEKAHNYYTKKCWQLLIWDRHFGIFIAFQNIIKTPVIDSHLKLNWQSGALETIDIFERKSKNWIWFPLPKSLSITITNWIWLFKGYYSFPIPNSISKALGPGDQQMSWNNIYVLGCPLEFSKMPFSKFHSTLPCEQGWSPTLN